MSSDGNLRTLFRTHLPTFFWTTVETGHVQQGVPDSHYLAPSGVAGWIEFKRVLSGNVVKFRPFQLPWLDRYARMGGRCFVAVRYRNDDLLLYRGADALALSHDGLAGAAPVGRWVGGIRYWNWVEVSKYLAPQP